MRRTHADVVAAVLICLAVSSACSLEPDAAPSLPPEPVITRMVRIDADQYRRIVRDVFGTHIAIDRPIEDSGVRTDGLLAVGASRAGFSASGYAALEATAQEVAAQVVADRSVLLPCGPDSDVDRSCANDFLARAGRMLWRRTLTETEWQDVLDTTSQAAGSLGGYYPGVKMGLIRLLVAPEFLFRIELAEPDPDHPGQLRLTGISKASRLSFMLWGSTPDASLLDAAERGELEDPEGLARHVDRMLASPRLVEGTRAFFWDMFSLNEFENFTKDASIYPNFTAQVTEDAPEQLLLTVVDHLLYEEGDYRDLFTSGKTFMTPSLAALLRIPLAVEVQNGNPDAWQPYRFSDDDPRGGLLAMPAFVALHSHAGRTSPTLRGRAVREQIMCQEIPSPPAAVAFNLDHDSDDPGLKTTRQRLLRHATDPSCAGCHRVTDPIGLPLESFDGSGAFRSAENGQAIDTSGELDGVEFEDSAGLSDALRSNREVPRCLAERVYAYGRSSPISRPDRRELMHINEAFAEAGFRFRDLLRIVATSDQFYREAIPAVEERGRNAHADKPAIGSKLWLTGVGR